MTQKLSFRSFKTSSNSLPQVSFIPTCFYGKNAMSHWKIRDYAYDEVYSLTPLKEYESNLDIEPADFYRYKKCNDFSPQPSDSGICQTFNGFGIKTILKNSKWSNSFANNFKGSEKNIVRKSNGIDMENGFIFSLGSDSKFYFIILS